MKIPKQIRNKVFVVSAIAMLSVPTMGTALVHAKAKLI